MKKLIAMTLLLGGSTLLCAQKTVKIPAVYKPRQKRDVQERLD